MALAKAAEVDRWFAEVDHPQKAVMRAVREAILDADDRVTETIKWKTPTFMYRGNIASLNPQAKRFVSLMFHRGAEIPGDHPALSGGGETARYMQFDDGEAVERLRPELEAIIRAWCDWRDAE
ncbi:MAG TPA: DUF1801 domain-containing protein [Candidatus Limnocylindrales bacterium]|nr:DUF1801 domain-containing protein [Candidatus Limnocylindrales bacterium]